MGSVQFFLQRELRGKLRIWISWLLVPLVLAGVRQLPTWYGIVVLALGTFLRYWASGYLHKESELCRGGPYRFTRNPLYLGSLLIAISVPISQDEWLLALIFLLVSMVLFQLIIVKEETVLKEKFGEPYREFLRDVPRFVSLSGFWRGLQSTQARFSWALWRKNKGWEPLLVGLAVLAITIGLGQWRLSVAEGHSQIPPSLARLLDATDRFPLTRPNHPRFY